MIWSSESKSTYCKARIVLQISNQSNSVSDLKNICIAYIDALNIFNTFGEVFTTFWLFLSLTYTQHFLLILAHAFTIVPWLNIHSNTV